MTSPNPDSSSAHAKSGISCGDELYSQVTGLLTTRFSRLTACAEGQSLVDENSDDKIQQRIFCGENLTTQISDLFRQRVGAKHQKSRKTAHKKKDMENYMRGSLNLKQPSPIETYSNCLNNIDGDNEVQFILHRRSKCLERLKNQQLETSSSYQYRGKNHTSSPVATTYYQTNNTINDIRPITPQQKEWFSAGDNDFSPTSVTNFPDDFVYEDSGDESFDINNDKAVDNLVKVRQLAKNFLR